eukprot:202679_1
MESDTVVSTETVANHMSMEDVLEAYRSKCKDLSVAQSDIKSLDQHNTALLAENEKISGAYTSVAERLSIASSSDDQNGKLTQFEEIKKLTEQRDSDRNEKNELSAKVSSLEAALKILHRTQFETESGRSKKKRKLSMTEIENPSALNCSAELNERSSDVTNEMLRLENEGLRAAVERLEASIRSEQRLHRNSQIRIAELTKTADGLKISLKDAVSQIPKRCESVSIGTQTETDLLEKLKEYENRLASDSTKHQQELSTLLTQLKDGKSRCQTHYEKNKSLQRDMLLLHKQHKTQLIELEQKFNHEDYKKRFAVEASIRNGLEEKLQKFSNLWDDVEAIEGMQQKWNSVLTERENALKSRAAKMESEQASLGEKMLRYSFKPKEANGFRTFTAVRIVTKAEKQFPRGRWKCAHIPPSLRSNRSSLQIK